MSVLYILLMLVALILVVFVLIFFICFIYLVLPSVRGAPFVTSNNEDVEKMIGLAGIRPGMRMADLGAGDGRIVIAFARAGAEAHGFEVNPFLVWSARRAIKTAGLEKKAFMHRKSFWKVNFAPFDVLTLYGITYIMKELEDKMHRELAPGSRVLSNYFTFPGWKVTEKNDRVCLYMKQ